MKKYSIILFLAVSAMAVACKSNVAPEKEISSNGITFCAATSPTKTSVDFVTSKFNWNYGDVIGICASEIVGSKVEMTHFNYPYVATPLEDPRTAVFNPASDNLQYTAEGSVGKSFVAYYPFTGTPGEGNPYSVPVFVSGEQQQKEVNDASMLGEYMVMRSDPVTIDEKGAVYMNFTSKTAVLQFKLKYSATTAKNIYIKKITLVDTLTNAAETDKALAFSGNLLMSEGDTLVVLNGYDSVQVDMVNPFILNGDAKTSSSIYMSVAPGRHDAGALQLKVTTVFGFEQVVTIPDAVQFTDNSIYVKEILLDPDAFKYVGEPIEVWKPVSKVTDIVAADSILLGYKVTATDSLYFISHDYTASGHDPALFTGEQQKVSADDMGNIRSIDLGSLLWSINADSKAGLWNINITFPASGNTAKLELAKGKTDGVFIYNSKLAPSGVAGYTYTESLKFTQSSARMMLGGDYTATYARWYVYPELKARCWRMKLNGDAGGSFVVYYKTILQAE